MLQCLIIQFFALLSVKWSLMGGEKIKENSKDLLALKVGELTWELLVYFLKTGCLGEVVAYEMWLQ